MCGSDWFRSRLIVSDTGYTPWCAWIHKNHSNGLRDQGLSVHMVNFISNPDSHRNDQYNKYPGTMCNSQPTMAFYPEIWPDDIIETFNPARMYNANLTDVNMERIVGAPHRRDTEQDKFARVS